MAERVHPGDSPTPSGESFATISSNQSEIPSKPVPLPGTYVIELPKDQIYRYPPPENAHKFQIYAGRRKARRSCCRRCLCWTVGLLVLLVLLLAVAAGILYLVFRPESPKYAIDDVVMRGLNLTSPSPISPKFDVTIRAENPNDKIGIYYQKGSAVNVHYSGIYLCDGDLPAFYQPSNNLTVFQTALRGSGILLTSAIRSDLAAEAKQGTVPLRVNIRAPVKIKVGAVKTWTINVKVKCDVTVDNLMANSKIVSKDCKYSLTLW